MSNNQLSVVRTADDDLVIEELSWTGNDLDNVVTLCYCSSYRSRELEAWLGFPVAGDDCIAA